MEASRGAVINDLATALSQAGTRTDVRKRLLLAFLGAVLGAGLLVLSFAAEVNTDQRNEDLFAHGSTTTGVVRSISGDLAHDGAAEAADITYEVAGRRYARPVDIFANGDYLLGQHVRVYYDPDDPSQMTITGVDNKSQARGWLIGGSGLLGLAGLGWGALGLFAWTRCRRALARDPWRSVHAALDVDGSKVVAHITDGATVYVCRGIRTTLPPMMWMFRHRPRGQTLAVGPVGKHLDIGNPNGKDVVQLLVWRREVVEPEGITSAG